MHRAVRPCRCGGSFWPARPARRKSRRRAAEIAAYAGLHAAAAGGSTAEIERLVRDGADINARDGFGRTPLMVAAYRRDVAVARALIELGANVNALEHQSYDVITIAAVQNDVEMLKLRHRVRRQYARHHQPLRRHRADRGRASGPCRGRARR